MIGKTYLESILDESGFGAPTEMGGFTLDKVSEVSLAPEPFWTFIFTSSALVGADYKRSVSTNFVPSGSLNTNPPTLMLPLLQSLHIHFSASFNAWVQYQHGVGGVKQRRKRLEIWGDRMERTSPRRRR